MIKKNSSIIDLRKNQIQSREENKYINKSYSQQETNSLANFDIPLNKKDQDINHINEISLLEFN
ncbi:MAG: hypothetical protein WD512_18095, partial [Candidatus Paceibacterota bacterium]